MSIAILDWRRQTHELYRAVRGAADPAGGHQLWCAERQRMFTEHPASADQRAVLQVADYDPAYRFVVPVLPAESLRIEIATSTDGVVPFDRLGQVELDGIGTLDVWWLDSYGGGVWLPLRDTSPDTYGGGRYLLDTVKGAELGSAFDLESGAGALVVDLNFAYNPSCAYDPAWACPLAPEGNRVDRALEVGELLPTN